MKEFLQTILLIAAIFALALIAEQIAPLKQLTGYLDAHPQPYVGVAIVMGVAGGALLIAAWIVLLTRSGRRMSDAEAQAYARPSRDNLLSGFRGKAVGVEAEEETSFRAIKEALRSGAWRRDASWWPFLLGLVGLPFALCGMFGYFFVTGPPTVKLIIGAALAYAAVRFTWAWWRA